MQYNDYPFSDDNMGLYLPTPFFKAYPLQTVYDDERRQERDADYFKSMYPNAAREIIPYVEDECDRMEYEGSMMFDECPDKLMLRRIRNRIYDNVKQLEDGDEGLTSMELDRSRRRRGQDNWLPDLIDVLLFHEMYKRRCRHRRCKRFY